MRLTRNSVFFHTAVLFFAVACAFTTSAMSGAPPSPPPIAALAGNASLSVSNASSRVVLPTSTTIAPAALLVNDGTAEVFFAIGSSTITATTTSVPLLPSTCLALWVGNATYVAAITASGSSTLRIIQFNGQPSFSC